MSEPPRTPGPGTLAERFARLTDGLRGTEPLDRAELVRLGEELVATAIEHERLLEIERRRLSRREQLEALLPAIAGALDVRTVFLDLAAVIQRIVPHDVLAFARLSDDRGGVKVQAATHHGLLDLP